MSYITVSVFNYADKKVCDLWDSRIPAPGQAYNLAITRQLKGTKSLSFDLPYMIDDADNWRWKYIRPEFKVRVRKDGKEDWFIIDKPKYQKSSNAISGTVTCAHISEILKTKNLYLYFDDENGIGTLPYLMNQILAGTGWSFDEENSDVFYENHATDGQLQEKVRSIKSDNKSGAYSLIGTVCDLFNGYPVYSVKPGEDGKLKKTVAVYDLNNKKPQWEMTMGKNLNSLAVDYDSSSIVTRLYVEGEYTDDGEYVGIEDVNPTGLSFLFNFDYYKSIGAFTDEHQQALDTYIEDINLVKRQTLDTAMELQDKITKLSSLWGMTKYVVQKIENSTVVGTYCSEDVEDDEKPFVVGNRIYIFTNDGKYEMYDLTADMLRHPENWWLKPNVTHIMKFVKSANGSIGAKQVTIEAKEQIIDELLKENEKETTTQAERAHNNEIIADNRVSIDAIRNGSDSEDAEEAFEFQVRVQGVKTIKGGETETVKMARSSTATVSSTSYYISTRNAPTINSNETVTTYANDVTLTIGDYGTSGVLPRISGNKFENIPLGGVPADILDVTLNENEINLTVNSATTTDAIKLEGTVMTINVKAIAYSLNEQFVRALALAEDIDRLTKIQNELLEQQNEIESDFMIAMGDLLKDGYWSNDNYVAGQEQYLYNDALDVSKEAGKPSVKYTVSLVRLSEQMGYRPDEMEINSKIRLYDEDLMINDTVYVTKIVSYLDDLSKSSVDISNEEVSISGASFSSVFSRIASIAEMVEQKQDIFKRAEALRSDGSLPSQRLAGAIDLMTTQLSSAVSSWYTDENGNIIFESVNGDSAMMLCGEGFMIADGKRDDGQWNWKTFGAGKGFTASALVTGYLSADRIEASTITADKLAAGSVTADKIDAGAITADKIQAGAITTNKISSDFGESLDLSSNKSITAAVDKQIIDPLTNRIESVESKVEQLPGSITATVKQTITDPLGNRVSAAQTAIQQLPDSIKSTVKTDLVDPLDGRVSANETAIEQLPGNIKSTVKTELIDPLDGRIDSAESAIEQLPNSIKSTVKTDLIDPLSGRVTANETAIQQLPDSIKSTVKTELIDPLDGRVSAAQTTIEQLPGSIKSTVKTDLVDPLSGRVSANETAIQQLPGSIKSTVKTELVDPIDGRVTANETAIQQMPNSIKSTVKTELVDPLGNRVTAAESAIEQLPNQIRLSVSGGGINLLGDTQAFGTANYPGAAYINQQNMPKDGTMYNNFAARFKQQTLQLGGYADLVVYKGVKTPQPGETYTFSFTAIGSGTITPIFYGGYNISKAVTSEGTTVLNNGDGSIDIPLSGSAWKRYWVTWTVGNTGTEGDKYVYLRHRYTANYGSPGISCYVAALKLEKGSVATQWTPSPYDPSSSLTNSSIQISKSGIDIKTGGTFTVDSGNFSIDQAGNVLCKNISVQNGVLTTADKGGNMSQAALTQGDIYVGTNAPPDVFIGKVWIKPTAGGSTTYIGDGSNDDNYLNAQTSFSVSSGSVITPSTGTYSYTLQVPLTKNDIGITSGYWLHAIVQDQSGHSVTMHSSTYFPLASVSGSGAWVQTLTATSTTWVATSTNLTIKLVINSSPTSTSGLLQNVFALKGGGKINFVASAPSGSSAGWTSANVYVYV